MYGNIMFINTKLDYLAVYQGGLAQMVERSLSMREVPGSIPGASKIFLSVFLIERSQINFN